MHRWHRSHYGASDLGGVQRADFASKARQGQAVAAVRGQVDLDAGVVQVQILTNVLAYRRIRQAIPSSRRCLLRPAVRPGSTACRWIQRHAAWLS